MVISQHFFHSGNYYKKEDRHQAKFDLDVRIDDTIHISWRYEKFYYLHNEGFWVRAQQATRAG